MKRNRALAGMALGVICFGMVGCQSDGISPRNAMVEPIEIELTSATNTIAQGDTVTIVTQTRNMAGREAEIEWATTGGKLETGDDHRAAQVRFDQPGIYTITAHAMWNGVVVDSDMIEIKVLPLQRREPEID